MEDKMKQVPELALIPLTLLNDLLTYLGSKPYTEVDPYIKAIQRDTRIIDKPAEKVADKVAEPDSATTKL